MRKRRSRFDLRGSWAGFATLALTLTAAAGCRGGPNTTIDYIDFVHVAGRDFNSQLAEGSGCSIRGGPQLSASDLGPVVATVRFDVSSGGDPHRLVSDGDAGRLPKGTKIYAVRGFRPQFRLAAYNNGRLVLYDLAEYRNASKGSDVIDIDAATVKSIGINAPDHEPVAGSGDISDPARVAQLVAMIMNAPIDNSIRRGVNDHRFCLTFRLRDVPWISLPYFPDSGVLGLAQNLVMPPGFRAIIDAATHP